MNTSNPFENIIFVPKLPTTQRGVFTCVDCSKEMRDIGSVQELIARRVEGVNTHKGVLCRDHFLDREQSQFDLPLPTEISE